MTNYSKQDLRDRAMEIILVKDAGETAASTDTEMVDAAAQQLIEGLEDESLLIFDSSVSITESNIPGRAFLALADLLAETIAPTFGREPRSVLGPRGQPESMMESAMRRLRRSVLDGSDNIVVKACYF